MAPEIHVSDYYWPPSVDMFAAGVVLFTMVMGRFPFQRANSGDLHYKHLIVGDYEGFWQAQKEGQRKEKLSSELKHLIQCLLSYCPEGRPQAQDILTNSNWITKERTPYRGEF